jgi:hypothetical protein
MLVEQICHVRKNDAYSPLVKSPVDDMRQFASLSDRCEKDLYHVSINPVRAIFRVSDMRP